jgi:hypothetical protein
MSVACGHAVRRGGRTGLPRSGEVTYVVAGGFNRGSDSYDFSRIRGEGDYVELVQSPRLARTFCLKASEDLEDDTGEVTRETVMSEPDGERAITCEEYFHGAQASTSVRHVTASPPCTIARIVRPWRGCWLCNKGAPSSLDKTVSDRTRRRVV